MNDLNDVRQSGEPPVTYHYAPYEGGRHWFSAEYDGDEVGYALVLEQQGPGGPHVEIKRLRTDPHYRGRGIGSRLLAGIGQNFPGRELRLKPYPIDERSDQDEGNLREFYSNRGFADYELKEGDPAELYDYMTRRAPSRPAATPADAGSGYLCGEPYGARPAGVSRLDAIAASPGTGSWPARLPGRPEPSRPALPRRRVASTASAVRQARPGRPR